MLAPCLLFAKVWTDYNNNISVLDVLHCLKATWYKWRFECWLVSYWEIMHYFPFYVKWGKLFLNTELLRKPLHHWLQKVSIGSTKSEDKGTAKCQKICISNRKTNLKPWDRNLHTSKPKTEVQPILCTTTLPYTIDNLKRNIDIMNRELSQTLREARSNDLYRNSTKSYHRAKFHTPSTWSIKWKAKYRTTHFSHFIHHIITRFHILRRYRMI